MTRTTRSAATLLLFVANAAFQTMAGEPPTGHDHAHHGSGALVAQLALDHGQPWATDVALRAGMAAVRDAFEADHDRIHAGAQTDAQYEALAGRIETQVKRIVAQCRLPPAADAQLHYVVGDLLQGVSLMRGEDPARSRHDGAARVHGALLAYPKYFDDPSWSPAS